MADIAIIGGGNMGEALIKGVQGLRKHKVFVCESNPDRVRYLKKKYKITVAKIAEAVSVSSIIILAVKPQDMEPLLLEMKKYRSLLDDKLLISIAAGLTTKFFERHLGGKMPVIRAMPNLPALIGKGITGVCAGQYAKQDRINHAADVLKVLGKVLIVKETMMDALTAVSGSGPAYVFLFVEQWMVAAKNLGFNDHESLELVYETLKGSISLIKKGLYDVTTLRAKVTSKGGTTQAAMDVFSKGKFDHLFKQALLAAKKRAKELAR